ncbi:hypothetical protein MAPG_10641 [Magnaporthiopsis poae ATCC 64411]|uniref:Uncharacterized protein n=1 Tax=Magnaporthiopsis poae (strain ATCC 64411 / 73-15) TaxID=644358 RepID=A0A0C4ED48_MAGP6|nr:hypothetical protein MAPG_10641 [Magnaporthiopsis poae ATCC 64411]
MSKAYCDTVTSKRALLDYIKNEGTKHLRELSTIAAPSGWGTNHLYQARVVYTEDKKPFLGIDDVHDKENDQWKEVIDTFPKRLERRPYVHYHKHFKTGTAAVFWQALQEANKTMLDDSAPPESEPIIKTPRPKRQAKRPRYEGYERSDQMTVEGSSPIRPRSDDGSDKNDSAFTSTDEHDRRSPPEDATVNLAMSLINHALTWYGPQQEYDEDVENKDGHNFKFPQAKPPVLSGSSIRQRMEGRIPSFLAKVEATSDGEIQLHNPIEGLYTNLRENLVALLEAKKRFRAKDVQNGEARIPDDVLAQVVGEALALRGTELSKET